MKKKSFVWAIGSNSPFFNLMTGYIHSFETFGTVDGPGIRFVVFMQGCPMRCKYCHNPDTWEIDGGKSFTPEEIAEKVLKYKSYLKGGGITVSGGEPLLQYEFVSELFEILKKNSLHTALDTSGILYTGDDKFEKLLNFTDLVLLDIKHIDETEHKKLTGVSNENVLAFARHLSDIGKDVWIRHVLVENITDKDEYLYRTADFIKSLKNVKKVEVLPYHNLGEYKYEKLGLEYSLKNAKPPAAERIDNARRILGI